MTVSSDVLVLGDGVAGYAAVLQCVDARKRVCVLTQGPGSSALSSGAWDLGGIAPDFNGSLEEWVGRSSGFVDQLLVGSRHWFDIDSIRKHFDWLVSSFQPELKLVYSMEKPFCIPTSSGDWKRTFCVQEIQSRCDLSRFSGKRLGVLESKGWRFRSDLMLSAWKEKAKRTFGTELDLVLLGIDSDGAGDMPLAHVATRLQSDTKYRAAVQESIATRLRQSACDVLLCPPLFLNAVLADTWQEEFRIPVAECLSTVEPVAGYRLHHAIQAGLKRLEIPHFLVSGVEADRSQSRISSLRARGGTQSEWQEYSADHFVLATGKFLGGGIDFGYHTVHEVIFDLPLFRSRGEEPVKHRGQLGLEGQSFQEAQPWACLGVRLDSKWRPSDSQEVCVFENVSACGSVIGGIDFAREGVGLGFFSLTGRECVQSIP